MAARRELTRRLSRPSVSVKSGAAVSRPRRLLRSRPHDVVTATQPAPAILEVLPPGAGAAEAAVAERLQGHTCLTDPPDPPGRDPDHQRVVRYVLGDHRAGGDHGPPPDGHGGDAHCPRPDGRSLAYDDPDGLPVLPGLQLAIRGHRAREGVVGEHHGGADEHPVLDDGRLVDQGMVLHLAPVAEDHAGSEVSPAADDALPTHRGVLAHLRQMPNPRSGANFRRLVDISGFCKVAIHGKHPCCPTAPVVSRELLIHGVVAGVPPRFSACRTVFFAASPSAERLDPRRR